ncbi:DUF1444 domain-containing protein [Macrococcus hajekii]|uniref:DUF1444 domain-containing protein n=1 Tax=Macrococcus hajekii TaxID=198482 RepID=A0A4R6BLJ1_9STAP|nr:DUF1444 domain-containing protein [Macrococcus hajekii]TDM02664.1 DUF1444 domain-containing protein [Macrococcus hajekii]GGB02876.1 UPF0354 protein [Macrococcus hajekii]
MNVFEIRDDIIEKLDQSEMKVSFDRKEETLRVERTDNHKGLTIKLAPIVAKYKSQGDKIIDEVLYYINETIKAMKDESDKSVDDIKIMPVIRSTSFPKESAGKAFVVTEHTAETNIYYALDLGTTYRLIDEALLSDMKLSKEHVKEQALFNIRKLSNPYKTDEVAGNVFYFFNSNDGYDASRVLNETLLAQFDQKKEGELLVATPHADVLIIADIRNETGYDIMAQMMMQFFSNGLVPVTSLSFQYDNGKLTPVFILGKNNAKRDTEAIKRIEANRKKFEQEKKEK